MPMKRQTKKNMLPPALRADSSVSRVRIRAAVKLIGLGCMDQEPICMSVT
jgi:hypothetical protein